MTFVGLKIVSYVAFNGMTPCLVFGVLIYFVLKISPIKENNMWIQIEIKTHKSEVGVSVCCGVNFELSHFPDSDAPTVCIQKFLIL